MHMHALQCLVHVLTHAVVAVLAQAILRLVDFMYMPGTLSGVAGRQGRAAGDEKRGRCASLDAPDMLLLAGVGALRWPLFAAVGEPDSHFWLC